MKVACLVSGGKDSLYACYIAMHYGWEIKCLIAVYPKKNSWMYHGQNIHLLPFISKAIGLPLLMKESEGEKEKELDDLKELIGKAKVEGVVSGAIASEYQRTRIEKICHEINVKSFTPIWHKNQEMLLHDLIEANFKVIITAVAAYGLNKSWLGRKIDEKCIADLKILNGRYGINMAGEGGEYETLVLDCPLYKKSLKVNKAIKKWDGNRGSYDIIEVKLLEK